MWSVRERALYWIDGRRDAIYRLQLATGLRTTWTTPSKVNAVGLARRGLIVAMKSGIAILDGAQSSFDHLVLPGNYDQNEMRMNDGKVDRAGRFWFGTMHEDAVTPAGRVYRLDAGRGAIEVDQGYAIPNGFAWSPDNRRMYLADSKESTIFVYDFDVESGEVRNRRVFAKTAPGSMPDGATVDAQGYLWSATVGGSAVKRYAPDGREVESVALPVTRPTSVIFGGDDLHVLFITTSTRNLTPEQLEAQPLAGAVFMVRVDVPGLPENEFGESRP